MTIPIAFHHFRFAPVVKQARRRDARPHHRPRRRATISEQLGVAWWNAMSRPERARVLDLTSQHLGRESVSAADAWALWRRGVI